MERRAMKKLINRPATAVEEMIEGLVAVHPGLIRLPGQAVVVRADSAAVRSRQVALISGGGSGHEPAHAGFVGRGMLSAAVAGAVFTSPSPDAVLAALRAVTGPPGALLIVKNYTGDRLNFGLAAEVARSEGLAVEVVVVADDVALAATTESAGRRGLAGTVLVHKVAGAAAEAGASLADVAAEARVAAAAVGTMGVALSPCTIPAAGTPGFTLGDDEIELGLGIHGEPGVRRGPLEPADALVDRLLDAILAEVRLGPGTRVALLVNNLGGTPTMELWIAARRALEVLESKQLVTERAYVGTFLSALEMAGISLTVLAVDDARRARLDAPTDAPAWPNGAARSRTSSIDRAWLRDEVPTPALLAEAARSPQTELGRAFEGAVQAAAEALIAARQGLTELDQVVGDGDLGISLARGAQAVLDALASYPLDDPGAALHALGLTVRHALGGTSGPLYAVLFLRAAACMRSGPIGDPTTWADAFRAGCTAIGELGGAQPGDRTMLDALVPASDAFRAAIAAGRTTAEALRDAADAAGAGARASAAMPPRRGRSSYLGDRVLGHPDPGAEAVAVWLRALAAFASPSGGAIAHGLPQ
jgi:dihydroxyacetone kinase